MELAERVIKAIEKIENSDKPLHPFELFGIEHGYGWMGLTLPIIEEVRLYNKKNPDNMIKITQVKEKFGGLRIYLSSMPDYLQKMICKAEAESEHICEFCGARGKNIKINGWVWTLCGEHEKAKRKAKHDSELEDRLYKESLDIRNYGWITNNENLTGNED
ncbi:MAG: hypothetical protein FWB86_09085 [Treponema sp.]|nr:hypothetical protein [Treponema sp.]MCL2272754.1 hypothetical protein [Treponema sp.]